MARAGTLTAAAAQLGTEHTTVARHIQRLEQSLGTGLFHRSNTGYGLTAAGERMLPTAEAMESAALAARAMTGQDRSAISGTVSIGAPDGFGSVFLAPRIHQLAARHPGLQIELVATARAFSLSKREADIAISLSSPEQIRVVSRRLVDYRLYVYGAAAYLAGHPPIRDQHDLEAHPFIGYIEDLLYTSELNYLGAVGSNISARIQSTNILAQVHATLAGGGLCILPAFIAAAYPGLAAVLPDQLSLLRSFYMHIHEDHRRMPRVREAAGFIADEAHRHRSLFDPQPAPGAI